MEDSRKKWRVCLIFALLLAVVAIGFYYYFYSEKNTTDLEGGVLVKQIEDQVERIKNE